jgi:hypothetical protein
MLLISNFNLGSSSRLKVGDEESSDSLGFQVGLDSVVSGSGLLAGAASEAVVDPRSWVSTLQGTIDTIGLAAAPLFI